MKKNPCPDSGDAARDHPPTHPPLIAYLLLQNPRTGEVRRTGRAGGRAGGHLVGVRPAMLDAAAALEGERRGWSREMILFRSWDLRALTTPVSASDRCNTSPSCSAVIAGWRSAVNILLPEMKIVF